MYFIAAINANLSNIYATNIRMNDNVIIIIKITNVINIQMDIFLQLRLLALRNEACFGNIVSYSSTSNSSMLFVIDYLLLLLITIINNQFYIVYLTLTFI